MPTAPLLTDEQRQALLDLNNLCSVTVVDPQTNVNYILLRADLYDRCRWLLADEPFGVQGSLSAHGRCGVPGGLA